MDASNSSNCTTVGEAKSTIIAYSVFSVVATLSYIVTIAIIVKTRAYRQLTHRLTLYLSLLGLMRVMAIWISVAPVDIQKPNESPVSVRNGWSGICSFGGFLNQYTTYLQTIVVVWLSIYIFVAVVFLKQLSQRKHEVAGLVAIFLVPLLFIWEPFALRSSYGLSGAPAICYVATPSCPQRDSNSAGLESVYVLILATIPQIVLTQFGLILMSIAIFSILRKIRKREFEDHFWLAMKEILPLILYPLLYLLVYFARMIGLSASKESVVIVTTVTSILIHMCSISLPISLLVRSNVRSGLCSKMGEEEKELISVQSHYNSETTES